MDAVDSGGNGTAVSADVRDALVLRGDGPCDGLLAGADVSLSVKTANRLPLTLMGQSASVA